MGKKTGVRTAAQWLVLGLVLGLVLAMGLGSGPAGARGKNGQAEAASGRRLPSKVSFHKSPSEESRDERERRLRRECQGRPNAGACLGFTGR